jgi:hypothetical protein
MTDDPQRKAKLIGESGCYEISLIYLAEKFSNREIDIIRETAKGIELKEITGDCYMADPGAFFSRLVGADFEVVKAGEGHPLPFNYSLKTFEYEILRYERPNPEGGDPLAHFVVGDGRGGVEFDPWTGSLCVAEGKPVSKRIVRIREATS